MKIKDYKQWLINRGALGNTLYYHYKSKCILCNNESNHFVLLYDFKEDIDNHLVADGNCKCGYKGYVDLKYVGRVLKPYWDTRNPNVIDPH